MKIIISCLIIINLFLVFIFTGCLFNDSDDENYYSYSFTIEINTLHNFEYNTLLPVIVNQNGLLSVINDNLIIVKGKGDFNIEQTKKGFAINISSNDSFMLESKLDKTEGKQKFYNELLSLEQNTDYNGDEDLTVRNCEFWIYYDNINDSSIEIKIVFTAMYSTSKSGYDTYSECNGTIKPSKSWQIMNGKRFLETSDK